MGLVVVGNEAGGRMRLGLHLTDRANSRPRRLGLRGFLIHETLSAKSRKALGHPSKFVTQWQ